MKKIREEPISFPKQQNKVLFIRLQKAFCLPILRQYFLCLGKRSLPYTINTMYFLQENSA